MSGRGGGTTLVCRWCKGPHEIEHCPAVLAAFVAGYDYQGNPSSSTASNPRKFRGRALTGRHKGKVK